MPRPLFGIVGGPEQEGKRVGWADRDAGGAVVAFLAEFVVQRVEAEFAHCVAFGTVVAGLHDPADAHKPVAPEQRIECAAGAEIAAEPAPGDQQIGTGDGETTSFQLTKTYESGGAVSARVISKPVAGSVLAAVDGAGAGFTVDETSGLVAFDAPPAAGAIVTAGFTFDTPVRFDTDQLRINLAAFKAGDIPSIPLIEVLV